MDDFTETVKNEFKENISKQLHSKDIAKTATCAGVLILRYVGCAIILAGVVIFGITCYFRSGGDIKFFWQNILTAAPMVVMLLWGTLLLFVAAKINRTRSKKQS